MMSHIVDHCATATDPKSTSLLKTRFHFNARLTFKNFSNKFWSPWVNNSCLPPLSRVLWMERYEMMTMMQTCWGIQNWGRSNEPTQLVIWIIHFLILPMLWLAFSRKQGLWICPSKSLQPRCWEQGIHLFLSIFNASNISSSSMSPPLPSFLSHSHL